MDTVAALSNIVFETWLKDAKLLIASLVLLLVEVILQQIFYYERLTLLTAGCAIVGLIICSFLTHNWLYFFN